MSIPINKLQAKRGLTKMDASEDITDWENHLVLRVPTDVASKINHMLDDQGSSIRDELGIQFTSNDMRHATVRVGQHLLSAKVFDLPAINEVMKTIDKKNFYKVADLSQVMVCSHDLSQTDTSSSAPETAEGGAVSKKEVRQWQCPHGLTPPMKSVRRRRFRKTKKKKYMDAPEVEKELKRLLRADLDAEKIWWEVVPTTDDKKKEKTVEGNVAVDDQALFGDKVTSSEDEDAEPEQVEEKDE